MHVQTAVVLTCINEEMVVVVVGEEVPRERGERSTGEGKGLD